MGVTTETQRGSAATEPREGNPPQRSQRRVGQGAQRQDWSMKKKVVPHLSAPLLALRPRRPLRFDPCRFGTTLMICNTEKTARIRAGGRKRPENHEGAERSIEKDTVGYMTMEAERL